MRVLKQVYQVLRGNLKRLEKRLETIFFSGDGFLRGIYRQPQNLRGKRLRPCLLFLSARATGKIKPVHFDLAAIVELLHNATIVHDDVLDEAALRRNLATFNHSWGNKTAVLFGDLLFSHAFVTCARVKSQQAIEILSRTANLMCYGELAHTNKEFDLSLKESGYLGIIEQKTASLFSTSCYLGALFTDASKKLCNALRDYGQSFGMAYQIIDDYYDLVATDKETGKTTGLDLTKGKITLPLIRAAQFSSRRQRNRLSQMMEGKQRKRLISLLDKYGALDYAVRRAGDYIQQAKTHLASLPDSRAKRLLTTLAESIIP